MGKDLIAELKARAEKGECANAETVLALIAEAARLDREADWLARQIRKMENACSECTGKDAREVPELREQARKAVAEQEGKDAEMA